MIGLDELILQVKESSTSTATFQGKLGKFKRVLCSINLKNLQINITFSSPQPMQLRNILQCKVSNNHQRKVENQNENKKTLGTLLLLSTTIIINVKNISELFPQYVPLEEVHANNHSEELHKEGHAQLQ